MSNFVAISWPILATFDEMKMMSSDFVLDGRPTRKYVGYL